MITQQNGDLINSIITIALGTYFTFARSRIIYKISDPIKKERADRIIRIAGPVVLACGIGFGIITFLTGAKVDLTQVVRQINAASPKMSDDGTRLDGATSGPGQRITFNYTLTSLKAQDIDRENWQKNVVPVIRKNVQKIKRLPAGVTVAYRISSSDGVFIDEVIFTPEDLLNK